MNPKILLGKDGLVELIACGYKHGIGPKALSAITGYSERTIAYYAACIGVRMHTTRPVMPNPLPVEFMALMAKFGLGRGDYRNASRIAKT